MARSAYPTGGARTPRLRMDPDEAVRLYRLERASWLERTAEGMEAERALLDEAMARALMQTGKARTGNYLSDTQRGKAANGLNDCLCGCGLKCQGRRRTATDDCLARLKTRNNQAYRARIQATCGACQRRFTRGKMPNQRYCLRPSCQRKRLAAKAARFRMRRAQQNTIADPQVTIHTAMRPNEAA